MATHSGSETERETLKYTARQLNKTKNYKQDLNARQATDGKEHSDEEAIEEDDDKNLHDDAPIEIADDGEPADSDEECQQRHAAMMQRMKNMHAAKKAKKEARRKRSLANLRRGSVGSAKKEDEAKFDPDEDENMGGVALVAAAGPPEEE